jgi:hypothetical protein
MSNSYYFLNEADYSVKNFLLWGNFIGHCKKATEGSLGNRIIHVFIAILEFPPIISQIVSLFEKSIALQYNLSARSKKMLEKALMNKSIKALYERANATSIGNGKSGTWKVQFVENTFSKFDAECNYQERKILLRKSLSDERALTLFVFELTNGISANEHFSIFQKALWGQIERENYAKEAEHIEYRGTLLHHDVMSEAVKEMAWDKALDIYQHESKDFETYWNHIKNSSHTDYHRKSWDNVWIQRKFLTTIVRISSCLKNLFSKKKQFSQVIPSSC